MVEKSMDGEPNPRVVQGRAFNPVVRGSKPPPFSTLVGPVWGRFRMAMKTEDVKIPTPKETKTLGAFGFGGV